MTRTLAELITATTELASLPSTTVRLLDLLDEPDVGADAVLEVIEKDPSLTANLLKLSNSAYYGLRRNVGTVREALVMLGNRAVLTLAFAASMGEIMRGPLAGYRLRRRQLWHHSLSSAIAAARLAADGSRQDRDRAFTAGLVHDIGKLLLDKPLQGQVEVVPPHARAHELLNAELHILGFDHTMAGAALAEAWSFPVDLAASIGHHHAPAADAPAVVRVVAAANLLANRAGFPAGADLVDDDEVAAAIAHAGATAVDVPTLAAEVCRDLEGMLTVLGEAP